MIGNIRHALSNSSIQADRFVEGRVDTQPDLEDDSLYMQALQPLEMKSSSLEYLDSKLPAKKKSIELTTKKLRMDHNDAAQTKERVRYCRPRASLFDDEELCNQEDEMDILANDQQSEIREKALQIYEKVINSQQELQKSLRPTMANIEMASPDGDETQRSSGSICITSPPPNGTKVLDPSSSSSHTLYTSVLSDEHGRNHDANVSANRPHPSLEYPPLYFCLKRWPWLFERIKPAYMMRWRCSYPMQKKVPFSRNLRRLGVHLTWGELLLLVPFILALIVGILYTVINPSVAVTGQVARAALIAALVFAQRNAIVTLLVGMPVDRTIFYHKIAGKLAYLASVLHACAFFIDPKMPIRNSAVEMVTSCFDGFVNFSGTLMLLFMTSLVMASMPYIRRRFFEVFYYVHLFCIAGMIIGASFHTGILVPALAMVTWIFDLYMRRFMALCRYPRTARIKIISDTVVELSFPKLKGFDYNPGQYIYIALPVLSWMEWHPFSISSSPKQSTVTLHIRQAGDWTRALYELAKTKPETEILIEGPYGSLGVDLMRNRYKMILLFSGGIGITPMQSLCDQLLYEQAKGRRKLKKIAFVWTERDPVMMSEAKFVRRASMSLEFQRRASLNMSMSSSGSASASGSALFTTWPETNVSGVDVGDVGTAGVPVVVPTGSDDSFGSIRNNGGIPPSHCMARRILSAVPPGRQTDEELDDLYASMQDVIERDLQDAGFEEDDEDDDNADDDNGLLNDDSETSVAASGMTWDMHASSANLSIEKILDLQVYLTGSSNRRIPYARSGRPDIKQIFTTLKEEAISMGEKRVAVCVCAPEKLTYLCRQACIVYSDKKVRFDFHSEPTA